jgi:hypothetical protein
MGTRCLHIYALTSVPLQFEHDIAYPGSSRDIITRDKHFHDEAMRLWALEKQNPTLANVQGLCILAFEYGDHLIHPFTSTC